MPVTVELTISENVDVSNANLPDEESFQLWAESACPGDDDVIASLQIINSEEMQALNKTYRGKDGPTNVLSFPMQLPDEVDIKILGDLALCVDVINEEAKAQRKSIQAHWAHMVIHGMLHLQGYDHIDDKEAVVMESMEVDILKKLGFENPYLVH
jgi:probable rRNA maturation factor